MTDRRARAVMMTALSFLLTFGVISSVAYPHPTINPSNMRNTILPGAITDTRVGFDCGLGSAQESINGTSFPVAPSENGNP
ncbi:MAG TPA: hypothetical protein VE955_05245, partial [Candidatus Dormibacteraeota bacterium]|nr:hypothetical protein [Candidatus Dormibacteraeota bacterium]